MAWVVAIECRRRSDRPSVRTVKDLQAGSDRELPQLGASIHEEIDQWQMALGEGIDLVRPIVCARLSFHGGSLLGGRSPWLVRSYRHDQ